MIARTLSTGQVLEDSLISVIAGLDPAIHHLWMNDDKAKPGHIACHDKHGKVGQEQPVQKVETGKSGECRAGYREPDRLLGHGKFRSVGWQQAVRLPKGQKQHGHDPGCRPHGKHRGDWGDDARAI
jgi:hypothetical protein